jgi:fluoroacetyl-CoA thioesterase
MTSVLQSGLRWTRRFEVSSDKVIGFMGDDLRVYASPAMMRDIETSCREKLDEFTADSQNSVGIRMELDHLRPTLIGMWVDVVAIVSAIEGRRVWFDIEVRDALDVVGQAKHVRFIVDLEKQKAALQTKAMRLSLLGSE